MKLLIQPEDGPEALLAAIRGAKKSIEIVIFRFDRAEIETALKAAVGRGVSVKALIAYTNRGGEVNLRKLEMRLLEGGVAVSRTADDLVRYHDKMLIIDRRLLFIMSFNLTHFDISYSRGFAIVTRSAPLVREAEKLFEADSTRTPYTPSLDAFVVSPVNARRVLGAFIKKAKSELLIYDPTITDVAMLRVLGDRKKAGVEIRIIGHVGKRNPGLEVHKLTRIRLHTRTIIRDRAQAFIGSQSLRAAELDSRRELGVIVREPLVVSGLATVFEADWKASVVESKQAGFPAGVKRESKDIVKGLVKELSPLSPVVQEALDEVKSEKGSAPVLNSLEMRDTIKEAVKEAVRDRVEVVVAERYPDEAQGTGKTLVVRALPRAKKAVASAVALPARVAVSRPRRSTPAVRRHGRAR